MKKLLFLLGFLVLPTFAFASVSLNEVVVNKGNATISGNTTGGATTVVNVDSNEVFSTGSATWSNTKSYGSGTHEVKAKASDGSQATATFTIAGGGADPMNFPCGGAGSCYESIASGEVVFSPRGVDGCEYFGGCVTTVTNPTPKYEYLKYGDEGCTGVFDFRGCVIEL